MKRFLLTLIGCTVLTGAAHAGSNIYQYTGTVSSITLLTDWEESGPLNSAPMPVGTISLGDSVSGIFSYNQLALNSENTYASGHETVFFVDGIDDTHTMSFNDSLKLGGPFSTSVLRVFDATAEDYQDGLSVWSYYFDNGTKQTLAVSLSAANNTISTSAPPPAATSFDGGAFFYEYVYSVGAPGNRVSYYWNIEGNITSVTQVSAVPEPGTYAMLLAGLGIVGWRRRAARLK